MVSKDDLYAMVEVLYNNWKKDHPNEPIIKDEVHTISVNYIKETIDKRNEKMG